ncbi:hypothetical protein TDB9533_00650 [Thalassocella blandensis]|nr:hypothetical protein TDB9533_00650 [Thalassocella blandensis]
MDNKTKVEIIEEALLDSVSGGRAESLCSIDLCRIDLCDCISCIQCIFQDNKVL